LVVSATTEVECLDEIQTKVFRFFLLAVLSHLYSFAFEILFLQTHATQPLSVSTVQLLYTVKEEGGNPDRKPNPLPYDLRNPTEASSLRNLKIMPRNLNEILCS
jgi:hypothetical protein